VSIKIGATIASRFIRVLRAIFAVSVILLWVMVSIRPIKGVFAGNLFEYPPSLSATGSRETRTDDLELAEAPITMTEPDPRSQQKLADTYIVEVMVLLRSCESVG
jgi:hypothetical protein